MPEPHFAAPAYFLTAKGAAAMNTTISDKEYDAAIAAANKAATDPYAVSYTHLTLPTNSLV